MPKIDDYEAGVLRAPWAGNGNTPSSMRLALIDLNLMIETSMLAIKQSEEAISNAGDLLERHLHSFGPFVEDTHSESAAD
jgi:hypothetical protein